MQGGTGRSPRRLRRRCGLRPQKPPCRAVWAAPRLPSEGACPHQYPPFRPTRRKQPLRRYLPFPGPQGVPAPPEPGPDYGRPLRLPAAGGPAGPPPAPTFPRNCPLHQLSPTQKAAPLPGTAGQRGGLPWPHPYFLGKVLFTHGTSTQESTAVITISGSM